jgi:putative transposase
MPRRPRCTAPEYPFHVLNRASRRVTLFDTHQEYLTFERLLMRRKRKFDVKVFAWCIMPNHWHVVVKSPTKTAMSRYLHWVTGLHAQLYHRVRGTTGLGPVYQGRYRSFPVSTDTYFYNLCRYVERNAVRAKLCTRASDWRWSSLWWHVHRETKSHRLIDTWPLPRPSNWADIVSQPENDAELERLRRCAEKSVPYGSSSMSRTLDTRVRVLPLRRRGRPTKGGNALAIALPSSA